MSDSEGHGEGHDDAFGLVIPFVNVRSVGGIHDDASFSAGYECGQLTAYMEAVGRTNTVRLERWVRSSNVDQIDLAAMAHGFRIESREPWADEPDEWTWVVLTNAAVDDPDLSGR